MEEGFCSLFGGACRLSGSAGAPYCMVKYRTQDGKSLDAVTRRRGDREEKPVIPDIIPGSDDPESTGSTFAGWIK